MVLDANVIVSAVMGGTPAEAVERALKEEVYFSPDIEAEFAALKERLRKRLKPEHLRVWTNMFAPSILGKMRLVDVPRRLSICRDPKDDAYLSLAAAIEADVLITGDQDLLSITPQTLGKAGLGRLIIMTPREFVERMGL